MKLSYMNFLGDSPIYLDMHANEFTCLAAFLLSKLICSEKLRFSSIMTPSTLTQVSDDKTVYFFRAIDCSFWGTREATWQTDGRTDGRAGGHVGRQQYPSLPMAVQGKQLVLWQRLGGYQIVNVNEQICNYVRYYWWWLIAKHLCVNPLHPQLFSRNLGIHILLTYI